eukprot:TRINITY_DN66213_c4_g1_i2.p1 TRINITY_DN66213_c4_g1~~TRINITY_DN66213_c4_g1_i2.p1  ORF type:complete len:302 (-),score=5.25 TRINITY_DN66213_c4_g1_i2:342-1247(-)
MLRFCPTTTFVSSWHPSWCTLSNLVGKTTVISACNRIFNKLKPGMVVQTTADTVTIPKLVEMPHEVTCTRGQLYPYQYHALRLLLPYANISTLLERPCFRTPVGNRAFFQLGHTLLPAMDSLGIDKAVQGTLSEWSDFVESSWKGTNNHTNDFVIGPMSGGAHKVDCGVAAALLNHMPGRSPGEDYLNTVRQALNSPDNFRRKTAKGNAGSHTPWTQNDKVMNLQKVSVIPNTLAVRMGMRDILTPLAYYLITTATMRKMKMLSISLLLFLLKKTKMMKMVSVLKKTRMITVVKRRWRKLQ